jgi:hypothetical protein
VQSKLDLSKTPRTWLIGSWLTAAIGVFIFPLSILLAEAPVPAVKLIEYG